MYKIYKNNILQFLQDNELNGTQNLKRVSQPVAKKTIDLKEESVNQPYQMEYFRVGFIQNHHAGTGRHLPCGILL